MALIGESGLKSVTLRALMRVAPAEKRVSGTLRVGEEDVLNERRKVAALPRRAR